MRVAGVTVEEYDVWAMDISIRRGTVGFFTCRALYCRLLSTRYLVKRLTGGAAFTSGAIGAATSGASVALKAVRQGRSIVRALTKLPSPAEVSDSVAAGLAGAGMGRVIDIVTGPDSEEYYDVENEEWFDPPVLEEMAAPSMYDYTVTIGKPEVLESWYDHPGE